MPKRPEEALADMLANLQKTTGKPLAEWTEIVAKTGLTKPGEIIKHLQAEYALTYGYARQIAIKTLESLRQAEAGDVDLVEAMYAGPKAALKPIHDKIIAGIEAFGDDVDLSPKKGYVSVRRNKQFAIVQPSTATRLDVGINLKGVPPGSRLEASGSFNAMLSHRVRVTSAEEVDAELLGWLRQAYDSA